MPRYYYTGLAPRTFDNLVSGKPVTLNPGEEIQTKNRVSDPQLLLDPASIEATTKAAKAAPQAEAPAVAENPATALTAPAETAPEAAVEATATEPVEAAQAPSETNPTTNKEKN
jgi:hypothetical protein